MLYVCVCVCVCVCVLLVHIHARRILVVRIAVRIAILYAIYALHVDSVARDVVCGVFHERHHAGLGLCMCE
jgi:hypothetical protein